MEVLGLFTRRLGTADAAACKARDTSCDMEQYYINKQAFTWLKHAAGKRCIFFPFFPLAHITCSAEAHCLGNRKFAYSSCLKNGQIVCEGEAVVVT